ncbi:hypothetical protein [Streptococcus sp. zg-JUN1979]|uniref:hypothetical protein n=1 Tax=Streptococcus sp. zg-JUN1979 TaxID=3391450 RepID=UPI0039A42046
MIEELNLTPTQMIITLIVVLIILILLIHHKSHLELDFEQEEPKRDKPSQEVVQSRYGAVMQIQHYH